MNSLYTLALSLLRGKIFRLLREERQTMKIVFKFAKFRWPFPPVGAPTGQNDLRNIANFATFQKGGDTFCSIYIDILDKMCRLISTLSVSFSFAYPFILMKIPAQPDFRFPSIILYNCSILWSFDFRAPQCNFDKMCHFL